MSISRRAAVLFLFSVVSLCVTLAVHSRSSLPHSQQRDLPTTRHATDAFDVKVTPLQPAFKTDDNSLGRMSLDKQYHGDLEATAQGEMLTASTPIKGSAAYVAVECVSGRLHGRTGAFLLQHSGTMSHGEFHLNVTVVPDSGTGQLAGLSGAMNIIITDGKHSYEFSYTLPGT